MKHSNFLKSISHFSFLLQALKTYISPFIYLIYPFVRINMISITAEQEASI